MVGDSTPVFQIYSQELERITFSVLASSSRRWSCDEGRVEAFVQMFLLNLLQDNVSFMLLVKSANKPGAHFQNYRQNTKMPFNASCEEQKE